MAMARPGREGCEDFTEVIERIGGLDFTRGARDLAGVVGTLRAMPAINLGGLPYGATAPGELSPGWPRASAVTWRRRSLYFPGRRYSRS